MLWYIKYGVPLIILELCVVFDVVDCLRTPQRCPDKRVSVSTQKLRTLEYRVRSYRERIDYPRDCLDIQILEKPTSNGIYTINPDQLTPTSVLCDFETDGGGWTIFQKRKDGSVSFNRRWLGYKNGFGKISTEFWLGNDNIHKLSSLTGSNELYVKLENLIGVKKYAKYYTFSVNNESDNYRVRVSNYTGTAGNAMDDNDNMMFTTIDRDNDVHEQNCGVLFKGAWWHNACGRANLNSERSNVSKTNDSLTESVMMIRRKP